MLLYINACVRAQSRTKRLADRLIEKLGGGAERLDLASLSFPVADEAFLERRDRLIAAGAFDDPLFDLARQFAAADRIVIAAPYWDLSFPAALKQYVEQINVLGITFAYTPEGVPKGLCRAKKLYYVMTAGGTFVPEEYGFGYVRTLAGSFYGIEDVELIQAVGLDLVGADPEGILRECLERIIG
jgi:FMN-dependent NADH-azoreductase